MEEPLVFDATPLIYLARANQLDSVAELADECLIPEPVYDEVVTEGLDAGYPDARRIEAVVEADRLAVCELPDSDFANRLERNNGLSGADVAVLTVAASTDGTAIMDERRGRQVARVEGIPVHGTAFLVLALLRDGVLDRQEALGTIDEMIDAGWHCSTDLYAQIRERIDDFDDA